MRAIKAVRDEVRAGQDALQTDNEGLRTQLSLLLASTGEIGENLRKQVREATRHACPLGSA